jgi:hypothetical protein
MYRVMLIPTEENPKKELWLEAFDVRETENGVYWDFVDHEDKLIRRLEKSNVESFTTAVDRRKSRPLERLAVEATRWEPPRKPAE